MDNLEVLRAELGGRAITITSGYRSPAHNRQVGGRPQSRHLCGQAADIQVEGIGPATVHATIERLMNAGRMTPGGLGWYSGFVHYDVRGTSTVFSRPPATSQAVAAWGLGQLDDLDVNEDPVNAAPPAAGASVYAMNLIPSEVVYDVTAGQEYGSRFGSTRPPGLPDSARLASRRGQARPFIETLCREQGINDVFVTTVGHLAETESGAMFARPANIFDVRPRSARPPGKSYISAWGAFQFNRDAWRGLPGVPDTAFPWDADRYQEIALPVAKYAELWRQVTGAGGSDLDAARGVRLWHRTPAGFRAYVAAGRDRGFATAWGEVNAGHRQAVDRHLRAGVSQLASQLAIAQMWVA